MSNQYAPNYTGVQIALSTNCNLLCPGCNRTHYDLDKYSLNPLVKKNQFFLTMHGANKKSDSN